MATNEYDPHFIFRITRLIQPINAILHQAGVAIYMHALILHLGKQEQHKTKIEQYKKHNYPSMLILNQRKAHQYLLSYSRDTLLVKIKQFSALRFISGCLEP